jgi:arylformamidase
MGRTYFDATLELRPGMPVYPGDPAPDFSEAASISRGDPCNVSLLSFGSHTGTHIDAPKHFYDDACGVDRLPLECFLGSARVAGIFGRPVITAADLSPLGIAAGDIILLKTDNSAFIKDGCFHTDYAHLDRDAAEFLVKAGIRTLGFDYFSVERFGSGVPSVHYALLGAGIAIIEGLDLSAVPPGQYEISALPLKLRDGNGSPARVVLYRDE